MKTLYFKENNLDLNKIKSFLEKGEIIGFPTETVYGLGALISKEEAIKKIYSLKKRSLKKSLIIHLGKVEDVLKVAEDIPKEFYLLANYFLPGPITVILKKRKEISSLISQDDTVAIRIPAHGITLKILKFLKEPIVGTSANISNENSPIFAKEVLNTFDNKISTIIDGGECPLGIPSTVINLNKKPKILRKGFVTKEQIERILKKKIL
jgi:L-threonylcarbamoyladenylate synthase